MRAIRLVSFRVLDLEGNERIVRTDKKEILKIATGLKKAGYKIVPGSFYVSDTIVMGYTSIIRMKKAA